MLSLHENLIKQISPLLNCRNQDLKQRKVYVKLHDDVIDAGGDVKIFSSMHVSGERKCRNAVVVGAIIRFRQPLKLPSTNQPNKTDFQFSSPQNSHS